MSIKANHVTDKLTPTSGTLDIVGNLTANGAPVGATDTATALSISAGAVTINCALGDYFTLALTANVTSISFSNLPGSGKGATKYLWITQGSGPYTVAYPSSFKWKDGASVPVSTVNGSLDLLALVSSNNGVSWEVSLEKDVKAQAPSLVFVAGNTEANITLSNGDRTATATTSAWKSSRGATSVLAGKRYWEYLIGSSGDILCGIQSGAPTTYIGNNNNGISYHASNGQVLINGGAVQTYAAFGSGDVVMIAYDADTGQVWFGKNGTWNGSPAAGTGAAYTMAVGQGRATQTQGVSPFTSGAVATINHTPQQVVYAPPTGFSVTVVSSPGPWYGYAFANGVPLSSSLLLRVALLAPVSFVGNLVGSLATANTAATASTVLDVLKNGTVVGTITFAAAGSSGTFATTSGQALNYTTGDILGIRAPATPDATLADIGVGLLGTR